MDQVVHQDANLVAEQRVATGVKVAFAGQTENITGQAQRPGRDRWGGKKEKEEQMVSAQIQIWQLNESNKLEMLIVHYVTKATNAKP